MLQYPTLYVWDGLCSCVSSWFLHAEHAVKIYPWFLELYMLESQVKTNPKCIMTTLFSTCHHAKNKQLNIISTLIKKSNHCIHMLLFLVWCLKIQKAIKYKNRQKSWGEIICTVRLNLYLNWQQTLNLLPFFNILIIVTWI